jgi:K+-sensing histidine kinase KdpD
MLSGLRSFRPESSRATLKASLSAIGTALMLVALLTAALAALSRVVDVETVTIIYLVPVLVAAIRGGVVAAVIVALASMGVAAFFFYPPIFDFRVHNSIHLVDLVLFIIVAVVTGELATHVRAAKTREQADILREALVGSVSHELRTPLSSIVGSASVLAQTPAIADDARLAALVQGLREEAERLDGHIQNLLDATRIKSEGVRPQPQWVDPGDIVNAAVEHKRRLLVAHPLKVVVGDDLPLINVDPMLIERALGQLIENAVKYSPPGSPIELRAEPAGGSLRLVVHDAGTGLTPEESERIWERFYRSPRHRNSTAGSGLGLWIARALVLACGGTVEAFSAGAGRGTTLSISLPVEPHASAFPMDRSDE